MSMTYTRSKKDKAIAIILTAIMVLTIYGGVGLAGPAVSAASTNDMTWNSSTSGPNKISMTEDPQTITVTFNIEAASQQEAVDKVKAGNFYMYRDKGVMAEELDHQGNQVYPYEFVARGDGRGRLPEAKDGTPWKLSEWKQLNTSGGIETTPVFSTPEITAVDSGNGAYTATCTFTAKRLFNVGAANSMRTSFLDATGLYKFEFWTGSTNASALASTVVDYRPYDSYRAMPEIYKEIKSIATEINQKTGYWAEIRDMGTSTGGRNMPYLIIAKDNKVVPNYEKLMERTETEPSKVLAELESGQLKDYQVPIMYSNIHADEFNGVDSILNFTQDIIDNAGGKITYDLIDTQDPFKQTGKEQYDKERKERSAVMPEVYDTLKKDRQPTGLGYITGVSSASSRKVDLDSYYNMTKEDMNVDSVLDKVFFIIVPEQNVDGRTLSAREGYGGVDLNRDNLFQTQKETQNMTKMIASWNPIVFWEQHGFVGGFQVEPCTPPHEANFEYDLLAQNLTRVGEAYGNGAISNNEAYNSFKMPMRDYLFEKEGKPTWDVWDDVSTAYTPEYAMLHGTVAYTVEVPTATEAANTALQYGLINNANFVSENRDDIFKNQVTGYDRGVKNVDADSIDPWYEDMNGNPGAEAEIIRPKHKENKNYFPEYYVIPIDDQNQKNVKAALEMQQWLLDSDVKVSTLKTDAIYKDANGKGRTAKAGSLVVDMHQAKRNVANAALSDGLTLDNWGTTLYSEPVTAFPQMRGFNADIVTTPDAFKGNLDPYTGQDAIKITSANVESPYTILLNNGMETTKAVNALLDKNAKVYWVTEGTYKGHFYTRTSDYNKVKASFTLSVKKSDARPTAKSIKKPKVFLAGAPASNFAGADGNFFGAREKPRVASSYYEFNYSNRALRDMGFDVTTNPADAATADIIVGQNVNVSSNPTMKTAILAGTPYIGYGATALNAADTLLGSENLNVGGVSFAGTRGNGDALYHAKISGDSLLTANMNYYDDKVMYNYGCAYIKSVPEGATVFASVDGKDIMAGSMPADHYSAFADSKQGFQYQEKGVNMTLYASSLTRKNHQQDDSNIISNAIFDAMAKPETAGQKIRIDTAPTASGITLGQKLGESKLTDGVVLDDENKIVTGRFVWTDAADIPQKSGTYTAEATFVPKDDLYESLRLDVSVAVSEKKPISISGVQLLDTLSSKTYTGKSIKPSVRVFNTNTQTGKKEILSAGADYVVSYKSNINVGNAKVVITGAGDYGGTKSFTFKITPKKSSVSKVTAGQRKMTVKWSKAVDTAGKYQVRYKAKGDSKWITKTVSGNKLSYTAQKLKADKAYQTQVRAYKKVGSATYYGTWSAVKTSSKIKK